jgi:hypothetical protein
MLGVTRRIGTSFGWVRNGTNRLQGADIHKIGIVDDSLHATTLHNFVLALQTERINEFTEEK